MVLLSKKDREYSDTFSAYYPMIFSTVCTKVGSLDDAEDITQNVFILYYQKMHDVAEPRTWLLGAMRFEVMNYYRKKGRGNDDIESIFDDPAHAFVNGFRDTRIIIEEAIDSIDDRKSRVIFDLVAIRKYTYKEASKALGMTSRQVRYRYQSVMQHIIGYLQEKGVNSIEDLL